MKRIFCVIVSVVMVSLLLVVPVQPAKAQFVIASTWDYPDELGQGIEYVYFVVSDELGNPYNWTYQFWNGTEKDVDGNPAGLEVLHNASISMRVHVWLNGTFTGYSYADGRDLYTKVGIEVYHFSELVFSQENISQSGGSLSDDPMWQYDYTILLNGNPQYYGPAFQSGEIYTLVINYEIYYGAVKL